MSQSPEAGLILGVDALYQRRLDLALLCVRFDPRNLDEGGRERLIELATRAGVPVLDPQQLDAGDRKHFYRHYLRTYPVRIDDSRSPNAALNALAQLLGLMHVRAQSPQALVHDAEEGRSPRPVDAPGEGLPTAESREPVTDIPLILAPREDWDRGSASDCAVDEVPVEETEEPDSRTARAAPAFALGPEEAWAAGEPRGKGRRYDRPATVPARPANTPSPTGKRARRPRFARDSSSGPARPPAAISAPAPGPQDDIRVRIRRGDAWLPARLRHLTTREVRLAASDAPPLGSLVHVVVSIAGCGAMVEGTVVEVINTERSVDGSTSFRVELGKLDPGERSRLIELLRMTTRKGLALTPPPPRKSRRFALSWPVAVKANGQRFNAAALDISERGLFLATTNLLRANNLVFGLKLDRHDTAVQGSARVARQVSAEMATIRGLPRGYGVQIQGLGASDRERFASFLLRVRERSRMHVMVAGIGRRSHLLADAFQAAGYVVSKASSVETMVQSHCFDSRPPDLAVVDRSILDVQACASFESALRTHQVPMLALDGQSPHAARYALDRMMSV